jgi:uncharacterized protein YpmB
MKYKYNTKSSLPVWIKWLSGILLFIVVAVLTGGIYLYHTIETSKTAGYSEAENKALKETDLVKIDLIERFDGKKSYYILSGETKDGEKEMAFMPLNEKKKKKTNLINESEIIPRESIIEKWSESCSSCKFIKIAPAMVNQKALWELTYVDESERYTMDYLSIYDGSRYEQFRFRKLFY